MEKKVIYSELVQVIEEVQSEEEVEAEVTVVVEVVETVEIIKEEEIVVKALLHLLPIIEGVDIVPEVKMKGNIIINIENVQEKIEDIAVAHQAVTVDPKETIVVNLAKEVMDLEIILIEITKKLLIINRIF